MRSLHVALVGEIAVGKTAFLRAHCRLPLTLGAYEPTWSGGDLAHLLEQRSIADGGDAASDGSGDDGDDACYRGRAMLSDGERVEVLLHDSSGLRSPRGRVVLPPNVAGAHVIVLCFSLLSRPTLLSAVRDWLPAVRRANSTAAVVLCGCKADLVERARRRRRRRPGAELVDDDEATGLATQLGARYVRCAAAPPRRHRYVQCRCARARAEGWATPSEVLDLALREAPSPAPPAAAPSSGAPDDGGAGAIGRTRGASASVEELAEGLRKRGSSGLLALQRMWEESHATFGFPAVGG